MGNTRRKERLLNQLQQAVDKASAESSAFIPEVITTLTDGSDYPPLEVRQISPQRRQQLREIQQQVKDKLATERQEPPLSQEVIDSILGKKTR